LGYTIAIFWQLNPLLIIPATAPLLLLYQALRVPELKQEAQTDTKTNLFNARHFSKVFTAEFERAKRFNRPIAIIMADLDLMRNINNTYGHLAGDHVLAGIGQVIRKTVREYDIAGRFGGEEFAIALPETSLSEARAIAERIRAAVETAPFQVATSPTPIHATLSVGVACFPQDSEDYNDLMHAADVAVYQAKYLGRNRVICAADIPHSVKLEHILKETVELDAIVVPSAQQVGAPAPRAEAHRSYASQQAPSSPLPPAEPQPDAKRSQPAANVHGEEATAATQQSKAVLWLFVGGVIITGVAVSLLSILFGATPAFATIGLLAMLAFLAELFLINLYGTNTVSVSVAIAFAAALISGIPGIICTSAAIALAHTIRQRPPVYRTAFNWATHLLSGTIPALATGMLSIPVGPTQLLVFVPFLLLALLYYAIETSLVAAAISLSSGTQLSIIWHQQFRWLASHYLVLCGIGLFMAIAFTMVGPAGIAVCSLPLFMMRYVQQQYVARTQESMLELQRMNQELAQANREIVSANHAIQQLNDKLRELNDGLFLTLGNILDARDPYVRGHAAQVSAYATAVAVELGLSPERIDQVRQAGFLHDIGKIAIAEHVLNKPAKLTAEEYEYIKTHALIGANLLESSAALRHLAPLVRHHHERWDGRGYPEGLAGEAIPLEARILNVCDSVEAMASDRPYHTGMSPTSIITEIRRSMGTQFDPVIAEAFLSIVAREGGQFIVNSALNVRQHTTDQLLMSPPVESFDPTTREAQIDSVTR
jgi:diguanylate cyclase (GGDEF)-like protein/putative nucleotidyltransferase with HDIG domain